jgi:phage terminase large subunit
LLDRFDIPADWQRYRAVDFGFTNPFVCQWWARDHDGRLYLYREIYMTGRTIAQHAPKIKALSQGEFTIKTVADHDAEDRATLAQEGIPTQPADKRITVGIEKVQERLKVQGDGRPRLLVLRDSLVELDDGLRERFKPTCTHKEFAAYVYPKGVDGKPLKEVPVDDNNHGMDALRYMVMNFDAPPVDDAPAPGILAHGKAKQRMKR